MSPLIGLTNEALIWVNNNLISQEEYPMKDISGETLFGTIYHFNNDYIAKEVIQIEHFYGGPVIFTHLHITKTINDLNIGFAFSWIFDPSLRLEFDYEKGKIRLRL